MPSTTDYAATLADARIAALRALTDILATSDDPTEKRLAAVAILRAPEPDAAPKPAAAAAPPQRPQPVPYNPIPAHKLSPEQLKAELAESRARLVQAGIDPDEEEADSLDLSLGDFLDPDPPHPREPQRPSPMVQLLRAAGCALSG